MAAAKKRKAKVVAKKTAAKKPAVRKKSVAPKKAPAKRVVAKPAASKPAAKPAAPKAAARPRPRPAPKPAAPARPEPLPGEERVGIVTHYFTHLSVAAILIESGSLRVGDTIRILGHTSDFRQRIESMQIDRKPVTEAGRRQEIGLKVSQHAREHDDVYKVTG
jgi:Elongation factor Tu domain 2